MLIRAKLGWAGPGRALVDLRVGGSIGGSQTSVLNFSFGISTTLADFQTYGWAGGGRDSSLPTAHLAFGGLWVGGSAGGTRYIGHGRIPKSLDPGDGFGGRESTFKISHTK